MFCGPLSVFEGGTHKIMLDQNFLAHYDGGKFEPKSHA